MGSITCSAECSIANSRARQKAGASASNRRYLYGISPEQFEALIQAQGGGCGVCGTSEWSGKGRAPHVDHDHATGAVRGVLCHHCNLMLGNAKDDPALLRAAADYLERPMPLP